MKFNIDKKPDFEEKEVGAQEEQFSKTEAGMVNRNASFAERKPEIKALRNSVRAKLQKFAGMVFETNSPTEEQGRKILEQLGYFRRIERDENGMPVIEDGKMKEAAVDFSIDEADLAKLKRLDLELKESIGNFKIGSWAGISRPDKLSQMAKNKRDEDFEKEPVAEEDIPLGGKRYGLRPEIVRGKAEQPVSEPEFKHSFFKTLFSLNGHTGAYALAIGNVVKKVNLYEKNTGKIKESIDFSEFKNILGLPKGFDLAKDKQGIAEALEAKGFAEIEIV